MLRSNPHPLDFVLDGLPSGTGTRIRGVGRALGWEASIVGSGPSHAPVSKRVALLCPNCKAPLPIAESYKFSYCAYCKVVSADVAREPLAPLSTEQPYVNEDGACWMGIGPHEVRASRVGASLTETIRLPVQLVFRLRKLFIDPSCAHAFDIHDLRIGINSQLISRNSIPASACAVGEGLPCGLSDNTATPGIIISLVVSNHTPQTQVLRGILRGTTLR